MSVICHACMLVGVVVWLYDSVTCGRVQFSVRAYVAHVCLPRCILRDVCSCRSKHVINACHKDIILILSLAIRKPKPNVPCRSAPSPFEVRNFTYLLLILDLLA